MSRVALLAVMIVVGLALTVGSASATPLAKRPAQKCQLLPRSTVVVAKTGVRCTRLRKSGRIVAVETR